MRVRDELRPTMPPPASHSLTPKLGLRVVEDKPAVMECALTECSIEPVEMESTHCINVENVVNLDVPTSDVAKETVNEEMSVLHVARVAEPIINNDVVVIGNDRRADSIIVDDLNVFADNEDTVTIANVNDINVVLEDETPDVGNNEIVILDDTLPDAVPIVDAVEAEVVGTDVIVENIVFTDTEKCDEDIIVDCVSDKDVIEGAQCKADACERSNATSSYSPLTSLVSFSDIPTWASLGIEGRHWGCSFKVDERLNDKICVFAGKPSYKIKTDVFAYLRCRHLTEKQRRTSEFFHHAGPRFYQAYEDQEIGKLNDGKLCITKAFDLEHIKDIYHAKGPEAPHGNFVYYGAAFKNILETAEAGHHRTLVIEIWKEDEEYQCNVGEGIDMILQLFRHIRYSLEAHSEWERIIICAPTGISKYYLMCMPFAFPTVAYDHDVHLSDDEWKIVTDWLL